MQWSVCIVISGVVAKCVWVVCQIIAISVTLSRIFFLKTGEVPPKKNVPRMSSGMSIPVLIAPWRLGVAEDHTTNFKLPSDIQQEVVCCWKSEENSRKIWESIFFSRYLAFLVANLIRNLHWCKKSIISHRKSSMAPAMSIFKGARKTVQRSWGFVKCCWLSVLLLRFRKRKMGKWKNNTEKL